MIQWRGIQRGVSALAALFCAGFAVAGPQWCESIDGGADAGHLISLAQITIGQGALGSIEGSLSGDGDHEDVFKIRVTDHAQFSAQTIASSIAGSSTFDTQLWLFDSTGLGVLGNNDDPGGGTGSLLSAIASDGIYYIAISAFGDDPLSAGGPIFSLGSNTEISGPDGTGGGSPLTGWAGGGAQGDYLIHFTGAEVAETPAPGTLMIAALGFLTARRGRRRI